MFFSSPFFVTWHCSLRTEAMYFVDIPRDFLERLVSAKEHIHSPRGGRQQPVLTLKDRVRQNRSTNKA